VPGGPRQGYTVFADCLGVANGERSRLWDVTMVILLAASVALVFWYESIDPQANPRGREVLEWIDLGLVAFFLLEWAWRVARSRPHAGRYAARNAWELLGMVPLVAPLPAFLRALRVLRIVRILRVFDVVGRRIGAWQRIAKEGSLHKIGLAGATITLVGGLLVWALERDAPGSHIADFSTAMWWAVVTVTTVGYGDVTPVTTMGRFVATILMVTGIGTIGLLASTLASVLVKPGDQRTSGPSVGSGGVAAADVAGELERLAVLRRDGHLSPEEFEAAKRRVLEPTSPSP
jgi:voltage-gated potassium channel